MALLKLDGLSSPDRELIGGKAWSINQMVALGIPVPPAFVITTDECTEYFSLDHELPATIREELPVLIAYLETSTGRTFGSTVNPLLVSVRSGAVHSMPGMMDTILNLGLNDEVAEGLVAAGGDHYAQDTYRRFQSQYKALIGSAAPPRVWDQLLAAICAIFDSWNSSRAVSYRSNRHLAHTGGTAVTVQAMVSGNFDDWSGTGVVFSRDPLTGATGLFGEWLPHCQGEDIVSGRHTPLPLAALEESLPSAYADLLKYVGQLESASRDVVDVEFTVESGRLWLLQSRPAKRSPEAAIRFATQLAREGLIEKVEALSRVTPEQLAALVRPRPDTDSVTDATVVATGNPACRGVVSGRVVTDIAEALDRSDAGERVILARSTTDTGDVAAMISAAALLTEHGGATSHAAVVSRELGLPCIVGCGPGTVTNLAGSQVTVDAGEGVVFAGVLPIVTGTEESDPDLQDLRRWSVEEIGHVESGSLADLLAKVRSRRLEEPNSR